MTSLWHHLSFLQTVFHISNSIEPTNFVLGTNTQQYAYNVHLLIKMKVTLANDEGHRRRSMVTKNDLMVISRNVLHSQTSYLVPRHNTISDIKWLKSFLPWLKVKVTRQRSQTWRCLHSLNAFCFFFESQNSFVTLCFRPFPSKKFFFEKPRNFKFFMRFGPRRSFYEKSSDVRRPASGVLRTKL